MKKIIFSTLLLGTMTANAAVIDFESASFSGVSSYTESGVTFSAGNNTLTTYSPGPLGGTVVQTSDFSTLDSFRADLSTPASFVSVDLGDFTPSDTDNIFLSVYDSSDNLLGTANSTCCSTTNEMVTLSLSFSDISYAIFGSLSTDTYPNSVYFDNFTVSAVPLPAAAFMFGPALLGLLGLGRKAQKA